jgi:hypothetical protein
VEAPEAMSKLKPSSGRDAVIRNTTVSEVEGFVGTYGDPSHLHRCGISGSVRVIYGVLYWRCACNLQKLTIINVNS